MARPRSRFRLDPASAFALVAMFAFALIAIPQHLDAGGAVHSSTVVAGVCTSTPTAAEAPADLPDRDAHGAGPCCAAGCAGSNFRGLPPDRPVLAIRTATETSPLTPDEPAAASYHPATGREQARPRAPPLRAHRA